MEREHNDVWIDRSLVARVYFTQASRSEQIVVTVVRPHGREVRVRHDPLVAQALQVPGHPFALRARLQEDPCTADSTQHGCESLSYRRDAPVLDPPVVITNAQLTLAFVQIQLHYGALGSTIGRLLLMTPT